mgnify:CR=1 FL=1
MTLNLGNEANFFFESDRGESASKTEDMKTIFCSIHGYTHWEDSLIQIINTAEFQRMKRIKQLAAVHHVFPGATHTRFEHSIGVGHLAECFAKRLIERHPTLPICAFTLKLAGLCHDLGHGPLSHGYDAFLCKTRPEIPMHEFRSVILLRKLVEKYSISLCQMKAKKFGLTHF